MPQSELSMAPPTLPESLVGYLADQSMDGTDADAQAKRRLLYAECRVGARTGMTFGDPEPFAHLPYAHRCPGLCTFRRTANAVQRNRDLPIGPFCCKPSNDLHSTRR